MAMDIKKAVCRNRTESKSAQRVAKELLANMTNFWHSNILDEFLDSIKHWREKPQQCVKVLRVLHEVTTHCTITDLLRLALNTELLMVLRSLLAEKKRKRNPQIIRPTLHLVSNLLVCDWRLRDAIEMAGIPKELLFIILDAPEDKEVVGLIIWMVYQLVRHKLPGPSLGLLRNIARTVHPLLSGLPDVSLQIPILRLLRLITEYQNFITPPAQDDPLLRKILLYVISPHPGLQREAIFVLANMCAQKRRRRWFGGTHLMPKAVVESVHGLVIGGTEAARVMVLDLFMTIAEYRSLDMENFYSYGITEKVIWCARYEQKIRVRLIARYALVSLAIKMNQRRRFIAAGGVNALCDILNGPPLPPVRLQRNILDLFVRWTMIKGRNSDCIKHLIRTTNTWMTIEMLQTNENAVVKSLAQNLTFCHARHLSTMTGNVVGMLN